MTKYELKKELIKGTPIGEIFELKEEAESYIYKAERFRPSCDVIYVMINKDSKIKPDVPLDGNTVKDFLIENCYNGFNFIDICKGHEKLADVLFCNTEKQSPRLQDILKKYDDNSFFLEFGFHTEDLDKHQLKY